MLMDGVKELEIIEDCHCESKVSQCLRAPSLRTYFFETPYETIIDVGKCVGSKMELGKTLVDLEYAAACLWRSKCSVDCYNKDAEKTNSPG